jgi:hypothetical protein
MKSKGMILESNRNPRARGLLVELLVQSDEVVMLTTTLILLKILTMISPRNHFSRLTLLPAKVAILRNFMSRKSTRMKSKGMILESNRNLPARCEVEVWIDQIDEVVTKFATSRIHLATQKVMSQTHRFRNPKLHRGKFTLLLRSTLALMKMLFARVVHEVVGAMMMVMSRIRLMIQKGISLVNLKIVLGKVSLLRRD